MLRLIKFTIIVSLICSFGVGCISSSSSSTNPATSTWERVGNQVSLTNAESEDPVMLLSTPRVGYRHQSYQIALNVFNAGSWGFPNPDPSGGNYETFYGAPIFCEDGDTTYVAFSHSGDSSSSGADFYDYILAYSWDQTNSWLAMNGGNEVSNSWPGNQWEANEATIACRTDADPVAAWVEADNASGLDNAYVALIGRDSSMMSGLINRNANVAPYPTDVRVVGLTADDNSAYVAQWEQHETEQWRSDLYVTELALPQFAQTNLGGALDLDYDGDDLAPPSLTIFNSELVVAYSAFRPRTGSTTNTRDIYVKRWDGASWVDMGTGPVTAYGDEHYHSNYPSLAIANGTLYLAWHEMNSASAGEQIFVASWDEANGQWAIADDNKEIAADISTRTLDPSLAYDSDEGYLYVAFEAMVDNWSQIYVKRRKL